MIRGVSMLSSEKKAPKLFGDLDYPMATEDDSPRNCWLLKIFKKYFLQILHTCEVQFQFMKVDRVQHQTFLILTIF